MLAIFKSGQTPHHEKFPDIFCEANDDIGISRYLQSFMKPRNPFRTRRKFALGWFVENQLRGYLLYHLANTSDVFFGNERWVCYVEDIAVDSQSRSAGGASQLMEGLLAHVGPLKNCLVSAQVWRGNTASRALFEKFQFTDHSETFYRIIE